MRLFRDLSTRDLRPERMEQPDLDDATHRHALSGLARVNALSSIAGTFWKNIHGKLSSDGRQPLHIVDIASGGGDVAIGIWRRARRAGVACRITALELSSRANAEGRRRAAEAGAEIDFRQADVLRDSVPADPDVIICSLFLHHLTEPDTVRLLKKWAAAGPRLILVSDLRRTAAGYAAAHLVCRLVTRSPVVHFDGPQSVAAAYTLVEMKQLCERAGLGGAQVTRHWPFRMLVQWGASDR